MPRVRISFDHLVGAPKHRKGDADAEELGSSRIDNKREIRRLLDRKLAGRRAAENSRNQLRDTLVEVHTPRTVANKAAACGHVAPLAGGGNARLTCQSREDVSVSIKPGVSG